jgi:membrane protein
MANHAAAGAYAFLLSAIPAILVILFVSSWAVASFNPELILKALDPVIGPLGARSAFQSFLSKPLSGFTGAFGIINLIWAARLFIVSIQRGIRVVYMNAAKANRVRENILTFTVELIIIIAVVLIISASQVARAAMAAIQWAPAAAFLRLAVKISLHILPILSLWLFVFLTYKNVPTLKPRTRNAAISSLLCIATSSALGALLSLTLNTTRYGLLYGILGNLIIGLIKVYFFFWLYFLFAELCYTIEYFDSLLFARFHRISTSDKPSGRIEKSLFQEPKRLFNRYARHYSQGQLIFSRGDLGRSTFYLYKGRVDIHLSAPGGENESKHTSVEEGELFGEMASILFEPRSAWALAGTDCTVFVLPPDLFERFLAQDTDASMRLMRLMANRLKTNNNIFTNTDLS